METNAIIELHPQFDILVVLSRGSLPFQGCATPGYLYLTAPQLDKAKFIKSICLDLTLTFRVRVASMLVENYLVTAARHKSIDLVSDK